MRILIISGTVFSFFVFSAKVTAQKRFIAGINAGVATSQIHGDTYSGFNKAGITGGASLQTALGEKGGIRFEINYIQKGSRKNEVPEKNDYNYYLARLNYIEVPVLLRAKYKSFAFEGGPGFGYMFDSFEENQVQVIHEGFRKMEISLQLGIGFSFGNNFEFISRFSNSVAPVRKFDQPIYYQNWFQDQFNKGYYNNVLTFAVHYYFGKNE